MDDSKHHSFVQSAFNALDHNNDGAINAKDLLSVYAATFPVPEPGHAALDEATANALISIASGSSPTDGQESPSISFQDFQHFLKIHRIEVIPSGKEWSRESLETLLRDLTQVKTSVSDSLHQEEIAAKAAAQKTPAKSDLGSLESFKRVITSDTVKHLIAGGAAGAVSRTIVSPLERMKILFQVQGPEPANYQGVIPTLRKMWVEEGMVGFMRGNGTNVIRIVPYSAVQFASYEQFKKLLMDPAKHDLDTPRRLAAGALAGLTSVACTYPLDIVRTRLSIQSAQMAKSKEVQAKLPGIWKTMVIIYTKEGGIVGLYRGLGPTLTGVAPYVALNFQAYEVLRAHLTPPGETSPSVGMKLVCGALAGSFAQTITYPLDVLRRRMQVTGMASVSYKYSSTWDGVKKIIKQEGVRGLYKGMVPNYLKVAPAISISFVVYEQCKQVLIGKKTTAGM
ncbi:solute carrier family 25 (mitochondrial phosphate transporter), member 23/24/25/41 [Entomortierella parvispora]|uniref:Solute carrier family 25 (Mitochondrial phosphate transporter), member 23/24/25/41 n=1 Tax=Entomortierella parvispora TaxID=205924 RepID=A0A9P3H2U5_9FUNG|nr:solute carrier family 25 (mitochondrial phosphate transporter), member 23/24/25/41 [Entomortierella parvispora]